MDFDLRRLRYLGYWKLNGYLNSDRATSRESTSHGTAKFPSPELGYEVKYSQDMTLLENPAFIRREAPRLLRELKSEVAEVSSGTECFKDYLYEVAGIARSAVLHHDDFREDDGKPKPRISVWLLEIPDPDRQSATWILLHGTADGNLGEYSMGEMPSTRAGSDTELFFDLLYLDAHAMKPDRAHSSLTPYSQVHATFGMLHDAPTQPIEAVFRCYHVLDLAGDGLGSGEGTMLSFALELSDGRAAPVSRLVVGSPLAVQVRARAPKVSWADKMRRGLRRLFSSRARLDKGDLTRRAIHGE